MTRPPASIYDPRQAGWDEGYAAGLAAGTEAMREAAARAAAPMWSTPVDFVRIRERIAAAIRRALPLPTAPACCMWSPATKELLASHFDSIADHFMQTADRDQDPTWLQEVRYAQWAAANIRMFQPTAPASDEGADHKQIALDAATDAALKGAAACRRLLAQIATLQAALENIYEIYEARSELFSNPTDLAKNLALRALAAIKQAKDSAS